MAWVVGIGLLVFFLLVFPAFRVIALVLLVGLAIGVITLFNNSKQSAEAGRNAIDVDQIEFRDLTLSNNGLLKLSGDVKNNSQYSILSLEITIRAFDCLTNVITIECDVIGQDTLGVYVDIPPSQVRHFNSAVWLTNMPRVKRVFLWSYQVHSVRASL